MTLVAETTMTSSCRPTFLRNALHMSNKAAVHISTGEYEQAVSTLSSALMQLKDAIRCPSEDDAETKDSITKSQPLRFLMDDDCNSLDNDHWRSRLQDRNEDEEWYLHRYPVQVSESCDFESSDCIQLLSYAGIYNLGLCHHLQALSPNPTRELQQQRLRRAASFYEHAQRLISSNLESMDPDMIQSLVIANNLGHAHYLMGNETTSKLCFQQLLNTIMYISDHDGSENLVALDKDRWNGFMVNIMQHLIGKTCAAAAA